MSSNKTYTISELSKRFDVTPRTIRFYEDKGLISPTRVKSSRVYRERDFVRLKLILRGKRLGFSLEEISDTLKLYETQPSERAQLEFALSTINAHRAELDQKKSDIQIVLDDMDDVEARIRKQLDLL